MASSPGKRKASTIAKAPEEQLMPPPADKRPRHGKERADSTYGSSGSILNTAARLTAFDPHWPYLRDLRWMQDSTIELLHPDIFRDKIVRPVFEEDAYAKVHERIDLLLHCSGILTDPVYDHDPADGPPLPRWYEEYSDIKTPLFKDMFQTFLMGYGEMLSKTYTEQAIQNIGDTYKNEVYDSRLQLLRFQISKLSSIALRLRPALIEKIVAHADHLRWLCPDRSEAHIFELLIGLGNIMIAFTPLGPTQIDESREIIKYLDATMKRCVLNRGRLAQAEIDNEGVPRSVNGNRRFYAWNCWADVKGLYANTDQHYNRWNNHWGLGYYFADTEKTLLEWREAQKEIDGEPCYFEKDYAFPTTSYDVPKSKEADNWPAFTNS